MPGPGDTEETPGIRPARVSDLSSIRRIDHLAGQRFKEVGLEAVADDDAPSVGLLATFVADGRAWVVCAGGRVLGFVLAEELDGGCHIEQLSILPDHQGRGLARSLVDHVAAWALERGYTLLSLTTFGDVAWNRPLFEHLGFEVEDTGRLGPDLKGRRAEEAARGLDPARRVVMVRNVQP